MERNYADLSHLRIVLRQHTFGKNVFMKPGFSWTSPLGISSALFIAMAVIYFLIGVLGIIITARYGSGNFSGSYFLSRHADERFFGKPIAQINRETPHFGKYITMMMFAFCSFMVAMGILQFGVARYALPVATNGHSGIPS